MVGGFDGLGSKTGLGAIMTSIDFEFVRTDWRELDVLEIVLSSGVVVGSREVLVVADWCHVSSLVVPYFDV